MHSPFPLRRDRCRLRLHGRFPQERGDHVARQGSGTITTGLSEASVPEQRQRSSPNGEGLETARCFQQRIECGGRGGRVLKTDTHSARISSECVGACLTLPRVLRARRGHNLLRACRRLIPIMIDRITPTTSRAASTTAKTFSASERSPNTMRITIAIIRAMALADSPNTTAGSQTRKFSYLLVNEPCVNKGISRIGKTLHAS